MMNMNLLCFKMCNIVRNSNLSINEYLQLRLSRGFIDTTLGVTILGSSIFTALYLVTGKIKETCNFLLY